LDATPGGQRVYKKFDFKDEYLITRMATTSMKSLSSDDNALAEPIQSNHIEEIIAFDELVFGANRTPLIKSLIKEYPHKAWALTRNNSIAGFALGREGNKYHQVGPVFASNSNDVKLLIGKALKDLAQQPVV